MTYQDTDPWMQYDEMLYYGTAIRGPVPNFVNSVCFIGSAYTYGRFCDKPFPMLVCDGLGLECFNLGVSGAGPEEPLFNNEEVLLNINKCKFCVLQVMSGRSVSNGYFTIIRGQDGYDFDGNKMSGEMFWKKIHKTYNSLKYIIESTLHSYIKGYVNLISKINIPTVLLNIHSEYEKPPKNDYTDILGEFPHLIEYSTIDKIKQETGVTCINYSNRVGLPQKLPNEPLDNYQDSLGNKFDKSINNYYPSPEMHIEISNYILANIMLNLEIFGGKSWNSV